MVRKIFHAAFFLVFLLASGHIDISQAQYLPSRINTLETQAGQAWSWGQNDYGQLGNNSTSPQSIPVQSGNLSDVIALAGGSGHSLAIRQDNSVWGWGANWAGQVGDNTTSDRHTPVAVVLTGGETLTGVKAISAGGSHSLALKNDGSVWAWGANWYGQLGDNTTTERHTPVQVKDSVGTGVLSDIIAISAGDGHSLALKSDGSVWAWGDNYYGQLGDNTNTQRNVPIQVIGPGGSGNLTNITQISAGAFFCLALKSDGTVWSWGQNDDGQLGDNSTTERDAPVQVQNISTADKIAAGGAHALAHLADTSLRAWGDNAFGQLGDNTFFDRYTPVTIQNSGGGTFTGVSDIAAGSAHSLARLSDQTAWSWGFNSYGQLGDMTTVDKSTPVRVANLLYVINLSAGYYHSLAIDTGPTAVTITGFTARWENQGYLIEWWTGTEIKLAGFNLYRADDLQSEPVKINPELIPAIAPDQLSGGYYSYEEDELSHVVYFWLEAVGTQGNTQRWDPVGVIFTYMPIVQYH